MLYISSLWGSYFFQLFSLFSVNWFFLGTFLFLVCFLISVLIRTFAYEK